MDWKRRKKARTRGPLFLFLQGHPDAQKDVGIRDRKAPSDAERRRTAIVIGKRKGRKAQTKWKEKM